MTVGPDLVMPIAAQVAMIAVIVVHRSDQGEQLQALCVQDRQVFQQTASCQTDNEGLKMHAVLPKTLWQENMTAACLVFGK